MKVVTFILPPSTSSLQGFEGAQRFSNEPSELFEFAVLTALLRCCGCSTEACSLVATAVRLAFGRGLLSGVNAEMRSAGSYPKK